MPRLNYTIQFRPDPTIAGAGLYIIVYTNFSGTPKGRIYKQGDTPPSFTTMSFLSGADYTGGGYYRLPMASVTDGIWVYEFQDNVTTVSLGKLHINLLNASTCYPETPGGSLHRVTVVGVIGVGCFILYITENATPTPTDKVGTLNDFTSSKTFPSTQRIDFSNSEMDALGISGTIDTIKTRRISNDCVTTLAEDIFLDAAVFTEMIVTTSKTDETSSELNDGTITLSITGGSGTRTYSWADGPTTQNRSSLSAGTYTCTITDTITSEVVEVSVTIFEPQVIPPVETNGGSYFKVPFLNCIHFVENPAAVDDQTIFQTLDNVLFEDQHIEGYEEADYYQPYTKDDAPPIQFWSDFPLHAVQLFHKITGAYVKSFPVELKELNIGVVEDFTISIRNRVGFVGQSKVYFSSSIGAIPIPLAVGEAFEILNNAESMNGTYVIQDILSDSVGNQYLVINLGYVGAGSTSAGTGRFNVSPEDFNVYEAVCDFIDIANGPYYIKIFAYNAVLGDGQYAQSEPLNLQVSQPKTNYLQYSNIDNGFDFTWTTGYVGKIRVPSTLFIRIPGGEVDTSRDADFSLVTTSARAIRGVRFQTWMLPPYLHEKLALIFKLDNKFINTVKYSTLENYEEPQYLNMVRLSNASIKLEMVGWFSNYNNTDISSIDSGGFIAVGNGGGRIKR